MRRRLGFTMIELLVVVSVIAALAGMLIPVISIVKRMANDVKCGNNLQQIASAIEVYKGESEDQFPSHLIGDGTSPAVLDTDNLVNSGGALTGLAKIFICPRDIHQGADRSMGRDPSVFDTIAGSSISGLYDSGPIHGTMVGSSYVYEASGFHLDDPNCGSKSWFYTASDQPAGIATWAMGKHNELSLGAPDTSGTVYSGPFSGSQFPIIRCFWHNKWTRQNIHTDKTVKNVTWDLNVFESIPHWEAQVDPKDFTP